MFRVTRQPKGEGDQTAHQQPHPAGLNDDYYNYYSYPAGPLNKNLNEPKGINEPKGNEEATIIQPSPDAAEIRACCVDRVDHAFSDQCSFNAIDLKGRSTSSRSGSEVSVFYSKPELYHQRWREQYLAKHPHSKFAFKPAEHER